MPIRSRSTHRFSFVARASLAALVAAGVAPAAFAAAPVGARQVLQSSGPPSGVSDSPADRPIVQVHTVAPGESLAEVAARYGVRLGTVQAANDLPDPDLVSVGQQIRIPVTDGVLHVVQPGETLRSIAGRYGVELWAVASANGVTDPDTLGVGSEILVPGAEAVAPVEHVTPERDQVAAVSLPPPTATDGAGVRGGRTYVVQPGDTLRSISESFGVDILSMVAANGLDDPEVIVPGRELRIVAGRPREHVVEAGETLAGIAEQYATDLGALLRANAIDDPDLVAIGTALIVPEASARAGAPAPGTLVQASRPAVAPAAPPTAAPAAPTAAPPAAASRPPASAAAATARVVTARVTGYAAGAGASSTRTASGAPTHWGTVAADTRLYPFGTRLQIEGFDGMTFVVEDTGSAVRGNVFDVWFADAGSARAVGSRTRRVTILSPGG